LVNAILGLVIELEGRSQLSTHYHSTLVHQVPHHFYHVLDSGHGSPSDHLPALVCPKVLVHGRLCHLNTSSGFRLKRGDLDLGTLKTICAVPIVWLLEFAPSILLLKCQLRACAMHVHPHALLFHFIVPDSILSDTFLWHADCFPCA
jgi:hypothetical protein